MLFHYTSFDALSKILQPDPIGGKEICFRATRYDCFKDKTEFKYGIECTKGLMDEIENNEFAQKYSLTPDHFIAHYFDCGYILSNPTIPKPFVISLTDSPESEKMWREYGCNGDGVVLGFDFNPDAASRIMNVAGQTLSHLDSCLYYTEQNRAAIKKELTDRYFECAVETARMGLGPSEIWLRFIFGAILCSFCARIKDGSEYTEEKETRIILYAPGNEWGEAFKQFAKAAKTDLTSLYDTLRNHFNINGTIPETLDKMLLYINDVGVFHKPERDVFFKEFFLPIDALKCLWVKDRGINTVRNLLQERKYDIPVNKARNGE